MKVLQLGKLTLHQSNTGLHPTQAQASAQDHQEDTLIDLIRQSALTELFRYDLSVTLKG